MELSDHPLVAATDTPEALKLRAYLVEEADSPPGLTLEALLLRDGVAYPRPTKPRPTGFRKARGQSPFGNAYRAAARHGWTYVEGFAWRNGRAIRHAWCVDSSGQVVETTWDAAARSYIGLPMRTTFVGWESARNGLWGVFPMHVVPWTLERDEWLSAGGPDIGGGY